MHKHRVQISLLQHGRRFFVYSSIVVCLEIQPKTTKVLHKIGTRIRLSKLRNDSNVGDYISIKRDRVNTKKRNIHSQKNVTVPKFIIMRTS